MTRYADDKEAGIRGAARHVRGRPIEHIVVLDAQGVEVWRGSGTKHSVACPPETRGGATIVHNHPGDSCFSYGDVANAMDTDEAECLAVGVTYTYRLRRPPQGWRPIPLGAKQALRQVRDGYGRKTPMTHRDMQALARMWPGLGYERLPTDAWLNGATFVAGAQGVQALPR